MALPSVEDLKPHVNLSPGDTSQDDELVGFLDAAVEIAEGIVGPLSAGTVTESHYGVASSMLVLRRMPVTALTSIGWRIGGTTSALPLGNYEVDTSTGVVRAVNGSRLYGDFTVTYSVGRATIPASVHLAVLIIAAHLFETQRMPMQGENSAPVGFGGGIDAVTPVSRGFALPNRAVELLRPYAQVTMA